VLALADRTVLFASAIGFRFIAHDTDHWTRHGSLHKNFT
jgi:hypothetical protein